MDDWLKMKIKLAVISGSHSDDDITTDELAVHSNGDVIIDRRSKVWWATPGRIAEWSTAPDGGINIKLL